MGMRYSGRSETSRVKPILNKKDTSHPPVTYKPLTRTGARSRDPSPIDNSERSSSSTNYDPNKLYPRPYQRSVSRERTESVSSSTTIPKYSGRTSASRDEIPRYTGRSSISKEDVPRYSDRSRDDSSKYSRRPSQSKDDPPSRYKIGSRTTSREDLSTGSQRYINSRFLPKNTIEKSNTAYTRPSIVRTHETSKRNRELLNTLQAQEHERLSRPTSRCSSVTPEDVMPRQSVSAHALSERLKNEIETQTITVISRGTSPTQTSQPSLLRSRRAEIAKVIEKQISRPKRPIHTMVDKAIQSDRLDDPTKVSRYSTASRTSSAPWSSFLDMKFSSPKSKRSSEVKQASTFSSKNDDSPKSLSRASSTKSLVQSSSNNTDKQRDEKKSPSPVKSKIIPPKQIEKQQLPPQIPKSESPSKSTSLHSFTSTNKDFRKSVLNMNPEGKSNKNFGRRSNSVSSAESDTADPDATDVSENLTSCKSYHSSCTSKLPQKLPSAKSISNRRSPGSEASTTTSGSEDDSKIKKSKKKCHSAGSSRTSVILSSADELSADKSPKPPQSPRLKGDGVKSEAEAKSFIMRALAPVTNFFKVKHVDSMEKVNWMDPSPDETDKSTSSPFHSNDAELIPTQIVIHGTESGEQEDSPHGNSGIYKHSQSSEPIAAKIVVRRIEPGKVSDNSQGSDNKTQSEKKSSQTPRIRHIPSGEIPWWLDEGAEIPEGVDTYPNWVRQDGTTEDGRVIYKMRKNDSGDTSWWLSSSERTNDDSSKNIMDSEYLEKHQIRHIDSGERDWWLNSSENISEMVQAKSVKEVKPKYAIRHQDSGEEPWWLQQEKPVVDNDENEYDQNQIPLGDRASPEGLEMPKQTEGRLSPYDNIPETRIQAKRPSHLFISRHTNIDDVLGGSNQMWSPFLNKTYGYEGDNIEEKAVMVDAAQVIIHENIPHRTLMQGNRL
ncbi:unnamed protein product [Phaedon cochleariae]|uniref:Uncharacterized protein n=1 Tax=Phaedon cochleariae TaxID=80249 RepID=A0A9N9SN89_PHACE|nr:unnamed protein product [Phaedon cochleariae]